MSKVSIESNEPIEAEGGGVIVSLQQMADVLGVHRQSMTKYLKEGCPYIRKANQKQGHDWELNTADVFDWYIDRGVSAHIASVTDPRERKLRKRAYLAESKLAQVKRREAWRVRNAI